MVTRAIPCVLMRGGTSRGPYLLASDLPGDPRERDEILIRIMGSGHELEIDGIGGGHPLTSKVAIIGPSSLPDTDVDYLFAQVNVRERTVDTSPNCGNMLAGVGPFALEAGLARAGGDVSTVKIHNVNTGKRIESRIQTPGGRVRYDGTAAIDGVPGTAAPIYLAFLDAAGAKTGSLLPTGNAVDLIDGIAASLIDAAMPIMAVMAADLGMSGYESPAEFAANHDFLRRLEELRLEAGRRMGLGDVHKMVIPKPVLLAPPRTGGNLSGRYFMPHVCHTAFAATGAVAVGMATSTPGTLIAEIARIDHVPADLMIEHPSGMMPIRLEHRAPDGTVAVYITRTARRIFEGRVLIEWPAPSSP
jgi:2-methylaconitate cis-trans-isomerase PrpF